MFASDGNIDTINQAIIAEVSAFIVNGLSTNVLTTSSMLLSPDSNISNLLKNALEDACANLKTENRSIVPKLF